MSRSCSRSAILLRRHPLLPASPSAPAWLVGRQHFENVKDSVAELQPSVQTAAGITARPSSPSTMMRASSSGESGDMIAVCDADSDRS